MTLISSPDPAGSGVFDELIQASISARILVVPLLLGLAFELGFLAPAKCCTNVYGRRSVRRGSFAEKHDVGDDIGAGVFFKRGIGETHGADKMRPLRHVEPRPRIERVHQIVGHNHRHQPVIGQGVERGKEELVMDRFADDRRVVPEEERFAAEGRIADCKRELIMGKRDVL